MRSKEDLFNENKVSINGQSVLTEPMAMYVMHEFAKEMCVEFGRWLDSEMIDFTRAAFTEELFNQFIQETNKSE